MMKYLRLILSAEVADKRLQQAGNLQKYRQAPDRSVVDRQFLPDQGAATGPQTRCNCRGQNVPSRS